MSLPDSYILNTASIPSYFDAILNAQPPERFSTRFLEGLGFKSTNDRLLIGMLKELGFVDTDGKPTERYFRYLDREQSERVLAEGLREAYSALFEVRTTAHELNVEEVSNKLRTLFAGKKTDLTIGRISKTFVGLCQIADFSTPPDSEERNQPLPVSPEIPEALVQRKQQETPAEKIVGFRSLQYHINISLPESRDPAVYDAVFKALKDHLG